MGYHDYITLSRLPFHTWLSFPRLRNVSCPALMQVNRLDPKWNILQIGLCFYQTSQSLTHSHLTFHSWILFSLFGLSGFDLPVFGKVTLMNKKINK